MSAMSEKARSAAKAKVTRLTSADPHQKVDSSGWTPPEAENGNAQTGMRVLSRRAFKVGGKVSANHAGRRPRKAGGALTADSLINRNVKTANEERDGTKHIGGLKRGGRPHKLAGGPLQSATGAPMASLPPTPVMRAAGGKVHAASCSCAKCSGGRVGKAKGGGINDGTRPEGGRLARAKGGSAKKGMNVNIIIASPQAKPAMPMAGPPPGAGPVGLHQGAPPPVMPPGAGAPMGPAAPPPQMRKRGGRAYPIESGAGGGLGRLEKIRAYG